MFIFVNMVNSADFSRRLEQIMKQHALNASSFAEEIGVGRSSISHILSGRNKPSLDFVLSILKRFPEVDLYWLLNGKGSYPTKSTEDIDAQNKVSLKDGVKSVELNMEPTSIDQSNTPEPKRDHKLIETPVPNFSNKGKNITKVIWFYEDGTFEEFQPNR